MIKKVLHISSAMHLSIRLSQLLLYHKETEKESIRPFEDIGFIILDDPRITLTQAVLQQSSAHNVAVVCCDATHHPCSLLFHLDVNTTQTQYFRAQISAGVSIKKKLWKQTVKAKIRNQAGLLAFEGIHDEPLRYYARNVKSADRTNREAQASRYYWPTLMGEDFLRRRDGRPPNNMLNYGYAVLRAAVARALSGSGLLPTLGIHHHNKYSAYGLADDIMEPYRPYVDHSVLEYLQSNNPPDELGKMEKQHLLSVLSCDVQINGKQRPLMVALSETSASLSRCFMKEADKISYPDF